MSVAHSFDVLPSAAPVEVSNALFTAVFESVTDKLLVVVDKEFMILVILALFNLVAALTEKPLCPIVPVIVKFLRAEAPEKVEENFVFSKTLISSIVSIHALPKVDVFVVVDFVKSITPRCDI